MKHKERTRKERSRCNSSARRGQAEIIGLLLIVILLAVGFLLYVRFNLQAEDSSFKTSFETSQLGQSFVTSLVAASRPCGSQSSTLGGLLKEIARGTGKCDTTAPTEDQVQTYISEVLKNTNYLFGRNYNLTLLRVTGTTTELLDKTQLPPFTNPDIPKKERCTPRTDGVTMDYQTVQLYPNPGAVEVRLYLCP